MRILQYLVAAALTISFARAAELASANVSLKNEVQLAIRRGADWLVKNQQADGHWSTAEQPALSALALLALKGERPEGTSSSSQSSSANSGNSAKSVSSATSEALRRGYEFLLKNVQPDGSIQGGKGLANYNTSLS